jgi:pimeloyl-ACP methyl ester carboxylesterase
VGPLLANVGPRWLYAQNLRSVYVDQTQVTDALVDRYWELARRPGNRRAFLERSATNDAFPFDALRGVRAPVLLQWGGRDRWVPPSQAAAFRARLPGAELRVYPDAGHAPMEELPGPTAADARRFLLGGPAASR